MRGGLATACGPRCGVRVRRRLDSDLEPANPMNYYNIWFDLLPGVDSRTYPAKVEAYLGHLHSRGLIAGWKVTRRKFGFGPPELGEWHVIVEVHDLTQLERAFGQVTRAFNPDGTSVSPAAVAAGTGPTLDDQIQPLHHAVYSAVTNFRSGLYRDYPDRFE